MNSDLISVIVPVYNAASYLASCLESLIKQTYRTLEIILVDDGSQDTSFQICGAYAKKDSRIKVIQQENQGVSGARNKGLREASGQWVMFVDSDDWIEPETCEIVLNKVKEKNADICGFNLIKEQTTLQSIVLFDKERFFENQQIQELSCLLLHKNTEKGMPAFFLMPLLGPYCKLYKKNILESVTFPLHIQYAEDSFFVLQVLARCQKVVWMNDSLYHYRWLSSSLVNKFDSKRSDNNILLDRMTLEFINNTYPNNPLIQNAFHVNCFQRIIRTFHHYIRNTSILEYFTVKKQLLNFINQDIYQAAIHDSTLNFRRNAQKMQIMLLRGQWFLLLYSLIKFHR